MAKKKSNAVCSPTDEWEKKYQIEQDLEALCRVKAINKDPKRLEAAKALAKEKLAENKAQLEALMTKLSALKESLSLAGSAAVAPELTVAADQIMQDVTTTPTVNNVAPPQPAGVQ